MLASDHDGQSTTAARNLACLVMLCEDFPAKLGSFLAKQKKLVGQTKKFVEQTKKFVEQTKKFVEQTRKFVEQTMSPLKKVKTTTKNTKGTKKSCIILLCGLYDLGGKTVFSGEWLMIKMLTQADENSF